MFAFSILIEGCLTLARNEVSYLKVILLGSVLPTLHQNIVHTNRTMSTRLIWKNFLVVYLCQVNVSVIQEIFVKLFHKSYHLIVLKITKEGPVDRSSLLKAVKSKNYVFTPSNLLDFLVHINGKIWFINCQVEPRQNIQQRMFHSYISEPLNAICSTNIIIYTIMYIIFTVLLTCLLHCRCRDLGLFS